MTLPGGLSDTSQYRSFPGLGSADQFDQQQVGKHQESNRPPVEGDRRDGAAHEPDPAPDQSAIAASISVTSYAR